MRLPGRVNRNLDAQRVNYLVGAVTTWGGDYLAAMARTCF
jgi:hypothetical protein